MKKMIFTAMAVLAFSAVSIANTIEVKEEVVVNNESEIELAVILEESDECQEFVMEMTDDVSFTDDEMIHDYYQSCLEWCYSFQ
jgi:hypothetical protein